MARRSSQSGRGRLIAEINVTPLVDVVLVLLVIFMLAAPVLFRNSIKVKLPDAAHGEKGQESPLTFSIDREGTLFFDQRVVAWDKIAEAVGKHASDPAVRNEQMVVISADQDSKHGSVIRLMDTLKGLGLSRFSLNVNKKGQS